MYLSTKPMFKIFTPTIKFDCLFLAIFQSFYRFVSFIFDKFAPSPNTCFKGCFKSRFGPFQCKKTVSKVLKTWYFHYSAFWSTGQLGRKRLNPGYAFEKHNDCCPLRQHSHLIALFEVFYNSGKIILL